MKEYTLYILDFDNTLFDTSGGLKVIMDHALAAAGLSYDERIFPKIAGRTMEQIFEITVGDESKRETFYEHFREIVDSDAYLKGGKPFPETGEVLSELKRRGKRIAIASGKYRYKIENLLEKYGMLGYPEKIVGYHDTARRKPFPDPILLAMSGSGVPPEQTVYVGDSPHDSAAAESAGIDSVIVNRHNGLTEDGIKCTFEISSLKELLEYGDASV